MSKGFKRGDHVCALYSGEREQREIAATYVAEGLRTGYRCLFVTGSDAELTTFRVALQELGIDTPRMLKRRALLLSRTADVHLAGGRFSSERMLRLLNDAIEEALDAGFKGLRTCGDMTWLLDEPEGHDEVLEYEALLNQMFQGAYVTGMCLFDHARLPLTVLDHAIATHTSVLIDGVHKSNPFYELPATAMRRAAQPDVASSRLAQLRIAAD